MGDVNWNVQAQRTNRRRGSCSVHSGSKQNGAEDLFDCRS